MVARGGRKSGDLAVGLARWQHHTGIVIFALLLFIWPIPHTITLRYLLLLGALSLFGYLAIKRGGFGTFERLGLPTILFAALSAWIVFGSVFISGDPRESLAEVQSQWLMAFLALMAGAAAGVAVEDYRSMQQRLLHVVVFVFLVHIFFIDVLALWDVVTSDAPALRAHGLTDGPDKASYLTSTLLAFILSELFVRFTSSQSTLKLRNLPLLMILTLVLVSLYAESVRNAVLTLIVTGMALIVLYLGNNYHKNARLWTYAMVAMGLFVAIVASLAIAATMQRETSWTQISKTVPIAWDTKTHKAWLDEKKYGLPKLPDGSAVEASTYIRVAWMKEGFLLVTDHPLGIGFDRNAFGNGLMMKYGEGGGHSHSGVLDLAIGTGVPGILLWFAFLASLAWLALRHIHGPRAFAALSLLLIVLDYSTRMFLDSTIKDHMLQQFMLVTGLLAIHVAGTSRSKAHAS